MWWVLAAAVLIAAGAVSFLLWQKMQVDREKLKMDLYDRRYAALMALNKVMQDAGKPVVKRELVSTVPWRLNDEPKPAPTPGIPDEIIASFRFLFSPSIYNDLVRLDALCIEAEEGVRSSPKKLEDAYKRLLSKLEPLLSVGRNQ